MPDLTQGYQPGGNGNNRIVEKIYQESSLDPRLPENQLAHSLFKWNFMPYARRNWAYDASMCNCEDLAMALQAAWSYLRTRPGGPTNLAMLGKAEKLKCSPYAMITKPWQVFAGPARGNVRRPLDGKLDGRCLFPNHWVCKIGLTYFDPTFDRTTTNSADAVERHLMRLNLHLWVTKDAPRFLYLQNRADPAPQFADSWNELDAAGWISAEDWKAKTARFGHSRSADLVKLDAALDAFQKDGFPAFPPLKQAFTDWYARNPKEASTRNFEDCVAGLASFLKVPVRTPV
ncbi:MAG: hypothetical protein NTW28_33540 [Candidatus Solibacter sp.]|nr:hypothetical protein [Candidatus Solibacter sp.]